MRLIKRYEPKMGVLELPLNSRIIHVGAQNKKIKFWADIDTEETIIVCRYFKIFNDDEEIAKDLEYVGTISVFEGSFIWHVFEDTQRELEVVQA
jgi:hypothetical protein